MASTDQGIYSRGPSSSVILRSAQLPCSASMLSFPRSFFPFFKRQAYAIPEAFQPQSIVDPSMRYALTPSIPRLRRSLSSGTASQPSHGPSFAWCYRTCQRRAPLSSIIAQIVARHVPYGRHTGCAILQSSLLELCILASYQRWAIHVVSAARIGWSMLFIRGSFRFVFATCNTLEDFVRMLKENCATQRKYTRLMDPCGET